jgi:hypothetical protein
MRLDFALSRRILMGLLMLIGLGGVCLLHKVYAGDQAKDSSSKQQQLVLSSLLPVIADGHALKVKVAEARRIILKLDQETSSAKSKLPAVKGVFDFIHFGLAKPAKPGEYGGGMLPRLEFIEKNLTKSLQDLAKLPSSCDASHQAQWRAGTSTWNASATSGRASLMRTRRSAWT